MSKLEVDTIAPQSGTQITIGESGDTVTIPTGVTLDASNATTTLPANVVTTDGTQTLTNKTIDASQLTGTITPSDNTVSTAKIVDGAVTSAKINYPLTTFSSTGIDDNATSTAITIDSSENVGIGETSPLGKLHVKSGDSGVSSADITDLVVECSGSGGISLLGATNGQVEIAFGDSGDANIGRIAYNHDSNFLATVVNGAEAMRIHNDGEIDINVDNSGTAVRAFHVRPYNEATGSYDGVQIGTDSLRSWIQTFRQTTSTSAHIKINNTNGEIGSITTNGTSTSFNTSSDHRLKENVNYDFDATTRLKQLKPARFNFIADANTTVDGFLAHEVQSVIPEAIIGTKDATETKEKVVVNANGQVIAENIEQADWETGKIADEDGNTQYPTDSTWEATKIVPVYQGIDQSKLVPLLVKTIQELEARITQLENA